MARKTVNKSMELIATLLIDNFQGSNVKQMAGYNAKNKKLEKRD